jgi:isoquinoline 1-oxidoreductase beta subunit
MQCLRFAVPMQLDRRALLIGGLGAGGLAVAYALWPRERPSNLAAADGEQVFGVWLKIGRDGHVTVAVPQCEHGQGVYTALPQILADELGADWRTVGVEAAPMHPDYANPLAVEALFGPSDGVGRLLDGAAPMLTGGSSSIRRFELPLKQAGAAARALLCQAAARRWGGDWRALTTSDGFVVNGQQKLRFGELADQAARESLPGDVPARSGGRRLLGTSVPRLDAPAKADGSANFAGDVRIPGMVFAAVRHGPVGGRLESLNRAAADRVAGMLTLVTTDQWVVAVANSWWAANRALTEVAPTFRTPVPLFETAAIDRALTEALAAPGHRVTEIGDLDAALNGGKLIRGEYRTGVGVHAAIEPVTATAAVDNGKLILWVATQAPAATVRAAAAAANVDASAVVLHPMMAGGSFGANLEHEAAVQAAHLAATLKKPVQLTWSRAESLMQPPPRPPAAIRVTARTGHAGAVLGWRAAVAAPALGEQLRERLRGPSVLSRQGDAVALDGAVPPYRMTAVGIDHHPLDLPIRAGWWRSGAHFSTCFAIESFLDELAHASGVEPLSYRIAMLGGDPRLARCLSTVASLGEWQGGVPGSGQGIACHAFRGSRIALLAEASYTGARPRVDRLVAAVDCGRMINPDLVLQAIEGGLVFGLAATLGASTGYTGGRADARGFRDLGLPRLADTPDITVELIESREEPGGVSELAVPVVGPAVANALFAATGIRRRKLPL